MAVIADQVEFGEYKFDPCKYPRWNADRPAFSHERVDARSKTIDPLPPFLLSLMPNNFLNTPIMDAMVPYMYIYVSNVITESMS